MVFELVLPIPETTVQLILVIIGFTIGDWFATIDYIYQQGPGFDRLSDMDKKIAKAFFDAFHHWQIGAVLLYFPYSYIFTLPGGYQLTLANTIWASVLPWIGVGIWGHDWKDWQHVLDRYKKAISDGEESEVPAEDPPKPPGT